MKPKIENLIPVQSAIALPSLTAAMHRAKRFLESNAPDAQIVNAIAANHTAWFTRGALCSEQFEGRSYKNARWLYTPNEVIVPFPHLGKATAGDTLNHVVAYCRSKATKRVACWSLLPARPSDLGARLCARGFEWGWQPHWMVVEPDSLRTDFTVPAGLRIAVEDTCDWPADDLPYYERANAAVLHADSNERTRRLWHFGAWLDGQIVGHALLFVTTGKLGVGGIYNVGVVPSARRQGIGGAVSLAACQLAFALGCQYVTLNSAADFLYARLGFRSLGRGQTWWMQTEVLEAPPSTPAQIAFAEAVGRGDIRTLERLVPADIPADVNATLPCGMTPMDLAVKTQQTRSVTWLQERGAELDVLQAWDLGWQTRVPAMLAANPELVNRRFGHWQQTLLHEAAMRGDSRLAQTLLAANPDLSIQDTEFHSTPLGWARHFERADLIALIEQHQSTQS